MAERVYRDLTPGLTDVPASTWAASPREVYELMIKKSAQPQPERLGLRELAGSIIGPTSVSDELKSLLADKAPGLLSELEKEAERSARRARFLGYGRDPSV